MVDVSRLKRTGDKVLTQDGRIKYALFIGGGRLFVKRFGYYIEVDIDDNNIITGTGMRVKDPAWFQSWMQREDRGRRSRNMVKKVESSERKYFDGYGKELKIPKSGFSGWYTSEYMKGFKFRYNFTDKVLECCLDNEFVDSRGLSMGDFYDGPQYWVDQYANDLEEETAAMTANLKQEMPDLFKRTESKTKRPKDGDKTMIKITESADKLQQKTFKDIEKKEGIVFLGCGGDLQEWVDGITNLLVEEKIVQDSSWYSEVYYLKTTGGRTDLVFVFNDDDHINVGKMAMWRLRFGDTSWISDYLVNYAKHHDESPVSWDEDEDEDDWHVDDEIDDWGDNSGFGNDGSDISEDEDEE